ncbi:MAG: M3 family metallopeptidase [Steroidobacteraceae bacterium]
MNRFRVTAAAALLSALSVCISRELTTPGAAAALTAAESIYADLVDAQGIVDAIDSGLFAQYSGKDQRDWDAELKALHERLVVSLASISETGLTKADARVLAVLRRKLDTIQPSEKDPRDLRCTDAQRKELPRAALSAALTSCFTEIANNLEFEGQRLDRVAALGRLHTIVEPERRKMLFLSFQPLWRAINGQNEADSAYRRLIQLAADEHPRGSPIEAAARTLGVTTAQVDDWLVRILETWSTATAGESVEPWDYRYASSAADRALSGTVPLALMLGIDHRYYRDLGVDLDALGVIYDLHPRANKSSVAYTDFLIHGRWGGSRWQPTIARVLATYHDGSLGSLNELVHENGHAVHISAIRNRPVFVDWNDDVFVEAFADVPAWSLYEPAWQRRYLGTAAPEGDALRALYGSVMLDVAWALFEARMLRNPASDPNAVWTQITHRYLHIVPHPELSWWAVRGQLVHLPGYMVNYGLGAVLTADLREHVRQQIGSFDTGNPRWYPWLSQNLLRYGSERDTASLLKQFLGRPVSADALLAQLRRIGPTVHRNVAALARRPPRDYPVPR